VSRSVPWTIADLLDFEYLLAAESSADEATERARDRAIFAEKIAPRLRPEDRHDRRVIFKEWLAARRAADPRALPGGHFTAGWQTLLMLAALAGLGVGVSLTAGLLHYKGSEPVNVAWFFAWTVGVQLAILLGALVVWLIRRTTRLFEDFRPLRWLLAGLLWSLSAGLRRLPGPQRERLRAGLATIGHRREIYGSLAAWPVLVVTQLFGVCFNIGVLATLLLHVALSDVAFGWQSTLRTSPEEAYRIASLIAAPWSFAPNAHPTLEQVVASRFAYSEGIAPLSPAAMASWWPFLCYAVAFYGLLVRGLLLAWSVLALRGALNRLTFDHQGCNALFRRLTGPIVQAQGGTASLEIPAQSTSAGSHLGTGGACFALVASDLALPEDELAARLRADYGWELAQTLPVQIDHPSANAAPLEALGKAAANLAGVVVVVRAKRAPIKAIALFLEKVTAAAGVKAETLVLLVGRREDGHFATVGDEEFEHWRNFRAIHGLRLAVERWRST
jgi:hypothetical protein